ncbi:MAG: mucin 2, oligomeric mucus/gel-forming, partial [Bacteroidetes bacterium]
TLTLSDAGTATVTVTAATVSQTLILTHIKEPVAGCEKDLTASATVTVTPKITPTFDPVAAICEGESFTLPTTSTNSVTGTWSPAVNNTTTTEYTFTPDAGQCAGTATMTVTVTPKVTPTFDQVATICEGESFTLPTTSTNNITGTWSPEVNNTTTTEYTFTPDAGQCAGTATMTVTVTPKVTPTFDQVAAICEGESFTLPTTSTNSVTGTWSPAVNNTTTTNSVTGTWSPAVNNTTTTEYTFTPDAGQCAGTATMTVTVTPKITPTFDPVATICEGESFTLPTTSTNSVTGTWSPAVNNTTTTEYTFTPDAGQCAGTATMTVTVTPKVTPIFDQVDPICEGDNIILPNTSTNSITGTWSLTSSTSKYKNYTFIPNAGQCAGTATMKVKVNKLPNNGKTSGFKGDEICKGEEATLTFNAIDGSFTTPYSIIYKVQGGTKTWTQSIDIKGEFSFTVPVKPMETTVYELVSISNATCTRTTDFGRATAKIEVI